MSDKLELNKDIRNRLKFYEYDSVILHTVNPARMFRANCIKFKAKSQIYTLAALIFSEQLPDDFKWPRINLTKRRSNAGLKRININIYRQSVGLVIHEIAHTIHMHSQWQRQSLNEKQHGKMFTVILDYLLYEYEYYWKTLAEVKK